MTEPFRRKGNDTMPDDILHDVQIDAPSFWITHVEELQRLLTTAGAVDIRPTDPSFLTSEEPLLVVNSSYWATNYRATPLSYDLIMVRSLRTAYDQPVVTDGIPVVC